MHTKLIFIFLIVMIRHHRDKYRIASNQFLGERVSLTGPVVMFLRSSSFPLYLWTGLGECLKN